MIQIKTKKREPFFKEDHQKFDVFSYTEDIGESNDGMRRGFSYTAYGHYSINKAVPEQTEDGFIYNVDFKEHRGVYSSSINVTKDGSLDGSYGIGLFLEHIMPNLSASELISIDGIPMDAMFSMAFITRFERPDSSHIYNVKFGSLRNYTGLELQIAKNLEKVLSESESKEHVIQEINNSPLLSFVLYNEKASFFYNNEKTGYMNSDDGWLSYSELYIPLPISYSKQISEQKQSLIDKLSELDIGAIKLEPDMSAMAEAIKDGTIPEELVSRYMKEFPRTYPQVIFSEHEPGIYSVSDHNYELVKAIIEKYPEYSDHYREHVSSNASRAVREEFGEEVDYKHINVDTCAPEDLPMLLENERLHDICNSTEYIGNLKKEPEVMNTFLNTIVAKMIGNDPEKVGYNSIYFPGSGTFGDWIEKNRIDKEQIKAKIMPSVKTWLSEKNVEEADKHWVSLNTLLNNYRELAKISQCLFGDLPDTYAAFMGDKENASRVLELFRQEALRIPRYYLSASDIDIISDAAANLGIDKKDAVQTLVPSIDKFPIMTEPQERYNSDYFKKISDVGSYLKAMDLDITKDSLHSLNEIAIIYFVWQNSDRINFEDVKNEFSERGFGPEQVANLLDTIPLDIGAQGIYSIEKTAILDYLIQDVSTDDKMKALQQSNLHPQSKLMTAKIWGVLPEYIDTYKESLIHECGHKGLATFIQNEENIDKDAINNYKGVPHITKDDTHYNDRRISVQEKLRWNTFKEEIKQDGWCFDKIICDERGKSDDGKNISINNYSKYMFGVPGLPGHIQLKYEGYHTDIIIPAGAPRELDEKLLDSLISHDHKIRVSTHDLDRFRQDRGLDKDISKAHDIINANHDKWADRHEQSVLAENNGFMPFDDMVDGISGDVSKDADAVTLDDLSVKNNDEYGDI